MYEVIVEFADLKDDKHLYHVGDEFPHNGMKVSENRLTELKTNKNKVGKPLIKEIKEQKQTVAENAAVKTEKKPKRGKKQNDAD